MSRDQDYEARKVLEEPIEKTPSVWIGEVSWLKAALIEDENFIPEVVEEVAKLIGEDFPYVDDAMIAKIREIFASAVPHDFYETADVEDVVKFLEEHKGKKAFTISW